MRGKRPSVPQKHFVTRGGSPWRPDYRGHMTQSDYGFETRAVHAGSPADPLTGAVVPPIHLSTTFQQAGVGQTLSGYDYARGGNPTRDALQEQLAALEGATYCSTFSSGLAAEDALLRSLLAPGDTIVMGDDVYGGTHRLVDKVLGPWGVSVVVLDMSNTEEARSAISNLAPRVVWVETPGNPLLKITDIQALTDASHRHGAIVVADNTFATPYLQRPLEFGVDVVVHSVTKYLAGHSDVLAGAVLSSREDIAQGVAAQQFETGAVLAPFDAWLTTRGIKTLPVRMDRHCANAHAVAEFLDDHPGVEQVYYPGLKTHDGYALAQQQMSAAGGMLSVRFANGASAARFAESTHLFTLAPSLGGTESLLSLPASMTHGSVAGTVLEVPDTIVRLSVGIESVDDLLRDLEQALRAAASTPS